VDEELLSLKILKRADSIFFLVDGENLATASKRQTEKSNFKKLIERSIFNNMISTHKGFYIIITKWDKVVQLSKEESIKTFFEVPMEKEFGTYIKGTQPVASRSDFVSVKAGSGLPEFLLTTLLKIQIETNVKCDPEPSSKRQFQRFKYIQTNGE
jgi:hypothetical protein